MTIQFVNTSLLRVGFEEHNPKGTQTLVLVHGWPDCIRTWDRLIPALVQANYRVLVPALRGFNPTTFLNPQTPRTGQLASLGVDLTEFSQALGLKKPVLIGHDWGARAVANACALDERQALAMIMISVGYATNSPTQVLSTEQSKKYWYHWFMATPRGRECVKNPSSAKEFTKLLWSDWAPKGWFTEQEFEQAFEFFANDDWAEVTLHSYTHRWGHSEADPYYLAAEQAIHPSPVLSIPSLVIHGAADGASAPETSANKEGYFSGVYQRHVLPDVGHFPQRECPDLLAKHILEFLRENC